MLTVAGGASRRVGPTGVLIGREHDCDIVGNNPAISRRHALVKLTAYGAELVLLGRSPIEINGKLCETATQLSNGDRIALPGLELDVTIELRRLDEEPALFRLERRRGGSFGISQSPFVLGSGDAADLIVKRWPERALVFHLGGGELFVEVLTGKAKLNGVEIDTNVLEPLIIGDELTYRRETFTVTIPRGKTVTTVDSRFALPRRVTIEMLPRGGRVVFSMPDGEHAVFLADRRLDLLIALLRPPAGHAPGDFVSDERIREIVWPRNPEMTQSELNMLISRCRRDLVQAGLAGPRLIERAGAGGSTRFVLAPGAEIIIRD